MNGVQLIPWAREWAPALDAPGVAMAGLDDFYALAVPGSRWLQVRGDITRSGGEYPSLRRLCTVTGTAVRPLRFGEWPARVPVVQQVDDRGVSAPAQTMPVPDRLARFDGDTVWLLSPETAGRVVASIHYLGQVDRAPEQLAVSWPDVAPVRVDALRAGDVVYGPADEFTPSRVGLVVAAVDLGTVPATVHTHEGWPLTLPAGELLATVRGPGWVTAARVYTRPRLAPPAPVTADLWHPSRAVRRARWDAFTTRFGAGPARVDTAYGRITPWSVSEFHPDPARRMAYFTGVGHPHHLRESPVPLFLSVPTLARYQRRGARFPVKLGQAPYAGDSGAYAALMLGTDRAGHPWSLPAAEYGALWQRLQDDIGPAEFVAIQDWPSEADVRAATGLTVREHQDLTLRSFLDLSAMYPAIRWLPTLQGWTPADYVNHFHAYARAGVDLTGRWVGIGSVCRRGSQRQIASVFNTLAPLGMRMHAFGLSINGLRLVAHLLHSSDSQAWSTTARTEHLLLPGCEHLSKPDKVTGERHVTDCRNCFRYAVAYREEVMTAIRECDRRRQDAEAANGVDMLTLLDEAHAA
jgi:hypothetical protein